MVTQCQTNFPFSWEPHALTYLGIQIPSRLTELYDRNHSLIRQSDLTKWSLGRFSWFGHIAILKMNVLPRILYILQTIPIKLPPTFFKTYKQLCRSFIWAHKSPRISWDRMILPKLKGGLGLPDIRRYHDACHIPRIIDWHLHAHSKDWITIEDSYAQIPLSHIPWINAQATPKEYSTHPLTGPTLTSFRHTYHTLKMTTSPGPMTPLTGNPDFPPDLPDNDRHLTSSEHKLRARHFFHNGSVLAFHDLPTRLPDSTIPFFTFLQIRHFLHSIHPVSQWCRDLHPFEALCSNSSPQNSPDLNRILFTFC